MIFSWAEISNVDSYDVYFGTNTLDFMGNQTTNTFDLGELEQLIGYQWKIVPINGSGTAEACEVWEFTTGLFQDIDLIEVDSKIG